MVHLHRPHRQLQLRLFAQVWAKDGRIIAVQPHDALLPTFKRSTEPNNPGRESSVPKAGATGLEPATSAVTGQRSNQLSYAPALLRGR